MSSDKKWNDENKNKNYILNLFMSVVEKYRNENEKLNLAQEIFF
jgi:hypothetical protein